MATPEVAIVIVSWNGCDLLDRCLRSIEATAQGLTYSIWVVDNGSTDGSIELVQTQFPQVHLMVSAQNLGFGGGNNAALRALGICAHSPSEAQVPTPPLVLLLNPDTIVQPGALQALVATMHNYPQLGAAGALLLNEDGSFQSSYIDFPSLRQELLILTGLGRKLHGPWYPSHSLAESSTLCTAHYVVGACMLARSKTLQQVGLFDEGFFMYAEEVDLCYRIRDAGWEIAFVPTASIIHLGGGSTRKVRAKMLAELYRSRIRFFRKHYGPLSAAGLQAILLGMTLAKQLRDAIPGRAAAGTPALDWNLLQRALGG